MKTRTSLLIMGMVLTALIGQSLMQPRRASAFDCETNLWNAFLNADSQYTSTFRSWYFGDPVSCESQCASGQCSGLSEPQLSACMSNCVAACNNTRYNSFTDAQDALISATSATCQYNPDACAAARARRDECVSTNNLHWENPVLDGEGNPDQEWASMVMTEYSSCLSASGISSCE